MNRALSTMGLLFFREPAYTKAPETTDFLRHAIRGDASEAMLGQLAVQKGQSDAVRKFGQMLSADHGAGAVRDEVLQLASMMGISVKAEPTVKAQQEAEKLKTMEGRKFDREFLDFMIKDHVEDIEEFEEASHSHNAQIAQLAIKTLPTLREHLQIAQSAKRFL